MTVPIEPRRIVLPTLNADGSRNRVRPELFRGSRYRARLIVAWALLVTFLVLPFLNWGGKPVVLLDVVHRKFVLFGRTFLPTDGVLLMLLLIAVFIGIFWLTAVLGRAWCGWACPQTVYLEFVFRPIERWFEGSRAQQLKLDKHGGGARRMLKNLVFVVLSAAVANVFLAYFVGVDALSSWVRASPFERPVPFLVMAVTAGLVFFDFAYFREQMCTVVCPYARLQSVLLDKRSLIVGYDARRGEPRKKGKPSSESGDCIDCGACVRACPTGIDIRDGLQLECIACAQCMDACDSIMARVNKPSGLIRYGTELGLSEGARAARGFRPRLLVYPVVLTASLGGLFLIGSPRPAEVTVLRGLGAPYTLAGDVVHNQIRIKIENRTDSAQRYQIDLRGDAGLHLVAPENPLSIGPGTRRTTTVFVSAPVRSFSNGVQPIRFGISDGAGFETFAEYHLLGPKKVQGASVSQEAP